MANNIIGVGPNPGIITPSVGFLPSVSSIGPGPNKKLIPLSIGSGPNPLIIPGIPPLLYSTMNNEAAIVTPEIGPTGELIGSDFSFVPVFDGNGLFVPYELNTSIASVAKFPGLSFGGEGTIVARWKPSLDWDDESTVNHPIIMSIETPGQDARIYIRVDNRAGAIGTCFFMWDGSALTAVVYEPVYLANSINEIAFVWKSTGIEETTDKRRMYFNNARQARVSGDLETDAIASASETNDLYFGNYSFLNRGADSALDDVRYFNKALTSFNL